MSFVPVIQEKKEKRARVGALPLNATQSLPLFLFVRSYIQLPVNGVDLLHHLKDGCTKESQRNIPNCSKKQCNSSYVISIGGKTVL